MQMPLERLERHLRRFRSEPVSVVGERAYRARARLAARLAAQFPALEDCLPAADRATLEQCKRSMILACTCRN